MTEILTNWYSCTNCGEEEKFVGARRAEEKSCFSCGGYSLIQLNSEGEGVKLLEGKQLNKSQTSVASPS